MGSPCELYFYYKKTQPAQQIANQVIQEIKRLELKYSRFLNTSFLTQINQSAGLKQGIQVDNETATLLDYAQTAYQQSEGLFDISSGCLSQLWDFKQAKMPTQSHIKKKLRAVGWEKTRWQNSTLFLPSQMQIDFGGFVKEYAADCAVQICRQSQINSGLVDLGGDLSIIGAMPNQQPWSIGIHHPRLADTALAKIPIQQGGLASSGDYERFFIKNGIRYCHIINPKTGYPIQNNLISVSILAEQCLIAGTATTIALLKKQDEALDWLDTLGLPYLCMDKSQKIKGTILKT